MERDVSGGLTPLTSSLSRAESGTALYDESFWTVRAPGEGDACEVKLLQASQGSVLTSSLTLILTSVGSGVFALPFAFSCAGIGFGSLIITGVALLSYLSADALSSCAEATRCFSYEEIAVAAWGSAGSLFVEVVVLEVLGGAMAAVMTLITDALPAIVKLCWPDGSLADETFYVNVLQVIIFCGVLLPLSCAKSMYALRYSNAIAVVCNFTVIGYVTLSGALWISGGGGLLAYRNAFSLDYFQVLQSVPILMLSFGMHVQAPAVYGELQGRSVAKFRNVLSVQTITCLVIYLCIGIFGIRLFGPTEPVPGDVLLGFRSDSQVALMMRAAVGMTCIAVFPLLSMPCRSTLDHLLFSGGNQASPNAHLRHALEASAIVLSVFVVSHSVANLGKVTAITGATGGALLCFVFPFLFYLSICREGARGDSGLELSSRRHRLLFSGCAIVGSVLMVLSFVAVVKNLLSGV
eukprot:TRINITY_DN38116_c0_g1_i1.p1 TRINITY_DN38116_c0_g1~~TRINITY_DN38116_c0_g1_i1.p1  ORF type:complete len:485 (+),score=65.75 TRINITY_DN38116_c0_g1_i1:62-1456(+)